MKGIIACSNEDVSMLKEGQPTIQTIHKNNILKNLWKISYQELFNVKSIFIIIAAGLIYVAIPLYLLNYRLLLDVELGSYPIFYKFNILLLLLEGLTSAISPFDATLLVTAGILFGINLALLFKTAKRLMVKGSPIKLVVGGGSILGFISTGCASCGFSVFSVFGLGTGLSFLPLGGRWLYLLSILSLSFSSIYMLKRLADDVSCKINIDQI